MIPKHFKFVEPKRGKMQVSTDRVWDRLRFVVIVETSEIAPAGVAAQFDQACAKHDAKTEPPKKPDHQDRRPGLGKGPAIEQWTKKDPETYRRFANRVAFEPSLENARPALTHSRQTGERAASLRLKMRPHIRTQAAAG